MKKKPFLKRWLTKILGSVIFYSAAFALPQNLSELMITTQSKIDICCTTLNSKIDNLNSIAASEFANTFSAITNLQCDGGSAETQFDNCCATLNSKVDGITQLVAEDFAGTFSVIASINCSANGCEATGISSATTISSPGKYCLTQNITGNITITSSNVAFSLNSFNLNGTVFITGSVNKTIISNGSIKTSNPMCISNNGTNVIIENIVMVCGPGANGALSTDGQSCIAISNNGSPSIIRNCKITAGTAGAGGNGNPSGNPNAGKGGSTIGINNTAFLVAISDCTISTLNGGNGGVGATGFSGNTSGVGGDSIGIMNTNENVKISSCKINTGNAGAGGQGGLAQFVSIGDPLNPGANGGHSIGINNNSNFMQIIDTAIICGSGGNGGNASPYIPGMEGATGGRGGDSDGIFNSGHNALILTSNIQSGFGGFGGSGTFAINDPIFVPNDGGDGGIGGNSFGIYNTANNNDKLSMKVIHSILRSNNGGAGGLGGVASGLQIFIYIQYGAGGYGGNGGLSAAMYNNSGNNIQINETCLTGGQGGAGGTGGGGTPSRPGGNGGNSYGIYNLTSNTLCQHNIIESSDGGNGGMGGSVPQAAVAANGGPGGNGGYSIIIHLGNSNGKIRYCTLDKAGTGGVGGQGGLTSPGGQPGGIVGPNGFNGNSEGIEIDPSASFSQINNSLINNIPGSGFGIYDASASGSSMILSNYAFNVSNPYQLTGANAIDSPNGTPFAAGTDRLANIYQPK
jgi:hypothetical protein